jgi:hypothetical protein
LVCRRKKKAEPIRTLPRRFTTHVHVFRIPGFALTFHTDEIDPVVEHVFAGKLLDIIHNRSVRYSLRVLSLFDERANASVFPLFTPPIKPVSNLFSVVHSPVILVCIIKAGDKTSPETGKSPYSKSCRVVKKKMDFFDMDVTVLKR